MAHVQKNLNSPKGFNKAFLKARGGEGCPTVCDRSSSDIHLLTLSSVLRNSCHPYAKTNSPEHLKEHILCNLGDGSRNYKNKTIYWLLGINLKAFSIYLKPSGVPHLPRATKATFSENDSEIDRNPR